MSELDTRVRQASAEASTTPLANPLEELLLVRELERFVATELDLLDGREFEAWSALFTDDGIYWAPSSLEQQNPYDTLSLLYDDREIRRLRFARLLHPRVHAQLPYSRTTHVVGNFLLDGVANEGTEIAFHCRFVMHDFRPEFAQRAFAGRYDYRLVRHENSFLIQHKKATIINCDAMHFPISIPF